MVQTAQSRMRNGPTRSRRADSPTRGLLTQPKMGSSVVLIVRDVLGHESSEMTLVQHNDVIEQIATTAVDPAFRNTVLPGASYGGLEASNAHGSNRCGNF